MKNIITLITIYDLIMVFDKDIKKIITKCRKIMVNNRSKKKHLWTISLS